MERTGRRLALPPAVGVNVRGGLTVGGNLHILTPENSHTVYRYQENCGPMYGGKTEARAKGGNGIVRSGRFRFGGDADSGPIGRKDGGR